VRVSEQTHADLLEVAKALNLDLSQLCAEMLARQLPHYLRQASKLAAEHREAREQFDRARYGGDYPQVALLLHLAKLDGPASDKTKALARAVWSVWKQGDPDRERLVKAALDRLREEEQLQEIREAIAAEDRANEES
jgi:hypothetical protein